MVDAAAAAERPAAVARPSRLCFHCGRPGHRAGACPSSDSASQTKAGQEAFQRYIQGRARLAKQRRRSSRTEVSSADHADQSSNDRRKGALHHFGRVVGWMSDAATDHQDDDDEHNIPQARDPIAVLRAEAAAEADEITRTQRWNDLHRAKYNDLHKAHREVFNHTMDDVRNRLASRLNVTPSDEAASTWQMELSRAVELGRPANFSSRTSSKEETEEESGGTMCDDDAGRCLKVYTVEKLQARCRQLHHLMFDDDEFAGKIRSMLLPLAPQDDDTIICDKSNDDSGVSIISLGGGPGYDHVAICLAARFLHAIQPQRNLLRTRRIQTQIFDLFEKDWEPVMNALGECCHEGLDNKREEENIGGDNDCCSSNNNINKNNGRNMTMHHADLRLGLDDSIHNDLARAVESVNIICIQFVLHENSSYILEEDGSDENNDKQHRIAGTIKDIFERAPVGTIMVCIDSANTLFPALKNTAQGFGWIYLGDEEKRRGVNGSVGKKITYLGPKTYVILERIGG